MNQHTRNRIILVALLGLFALPLAVAFVLSSSGWQPERTRNAGVLVHPPRDVSATPITLEDGKSYAWRDPGLRWTLLMLPGHACAQHCLTRIEEALRMRITLGRNSERVRALYLGPALPAGFIPAHTPLLAGHDTDGTFAAERAQGNDDLALALIDPQGQLLLRYPGGYSAQGLRSDIAKIIY